MSAFLVCAGASGSGYASVLGSWSLRLPWGSSRHASETGPVGVRAAALLVQGEGSPGCGWPGGRDSDAGGAREQPAVGASELLGMSERQFLRYRGRYEDEGEAGLLDRRLGKASPRRVPESDRQRMLDLYREMHPGSPHPETSTSCVPVATLSGSSRPSSGSRSKPDNSHATKPDNSHAYDTSCSNSHFGIAIFFMLGSITLNRFLIQASCVGFD
jgi:hypothetical protein